MSSGTFRLSGLWPPMAEAVRFYLAWADYLGIEVSIREAYRDNQTQAEYYAKGRTPDEIRNHVKKHFRGGAVTDAPPGTSPHNYGLAIDIDSPQLERAMALGRQIGFGTVTGDLDHLEWPGWRQLLG